MFEKVRCVIIFCLVCYRLHFQQWPVYVSYKMLNRVEQLILNFKRTGFYNMNFWFGILPTIVDWIWKRAHLYNINFWFETLSTVADCVPVLLFVLTLKRQIRAVLWKLLTPIEYYHRIILILNREECSVVGQLLLDMSAAEISQGYNLPDSRW